MFGTFSSAPLLHLLVHHALHLVPLFSLCIVDSNQWSLEIENISIILIDTDTDSTRRRKTFYRCNFISIKLRKKWDIYLENIYKNCDWLINTWAVSNSINAHAESNFITVSRLIYSIVFNSCLKHLNSFFLGFYSKI